MNRKVKLWKWVPAVILGLASLWVQGQVSYQSDISRCSVLVDSIMKLQHIPGMAVSVSIDGRIVWSEGFGLANVENQIPVYPAVSIFRIGSISKTLTSIGLAKLYEEGKVDLDDTIQAYVPTFPIKRYPISVRQVAGHIAGIRHYKGAEFLNSEHYAAIDEGLEIFAEDSLLFEPGTMFSYSSYGWNLISAVIEKASDMNFLTYMSQQVFTPLGMRNTYPDIHERILPGRTGYYLFINDQLINAPFVDNSYKWAGGGFLSTAEDLLRFAHGQFNNELITAETLEEWTTSLVTSDSEPTNYGIGWRIGTDSRGNNWVGHSGGSMGGTSMMMMYPENKLAVIILTNISGASLGHLSDKIATSFYKWAR